MERSFFFTSFFVLYSCFILSFVFFFFLVLLIYFRLLFSFFSFFVFFSSYFVLYAYLFLVWHLPLFLVFVFQRAPPPLIFIFCSVLGKGGGGGEGKGRGTEGLKHPGLMLSCPRCLSCFDRHQRRRYAIPCRPCVKFVRLSLFPLFRYEFRDLKTSGNEGNNINKKNTKTHTAVWWKIKSRRTMSGFFFSKIVTTTTKTLTNIKRKNRVTQCSAIRKCHESFVFCSFVANREKQNRVPLEFVFTLIK